jgi:hypothetical protein
MRSDPYTWNRGLAAWLFRKQLDCSTRYDGVRWSPSAAPIRMRLNMGRRRGPRSWRPGPTGIPLNDAPSQVASQLVAQHQTQRGTFNSCINAVMLLARSRVQISSTTRRAPEPPSIGPARLRNLSLAFSGAGMLAGCPGGVSYRRRSCVPLCSRTSTSPPAAPGQRAVSPASPPTRSAQAGRTASALCAPHRRIPAPCTGRTSKLRPYNR